MRSLKVQSPEQRPPVRLSSRLPEQSVAFPEGEQQALPFPDAAWMVSQVKAWMETEGIGPVRAESLVYHLYGNWAMTCQLRSSREPRPRLERLQPPRSPENAAKAG
jgi:hypothetical protein